MIRICRKKEAILKSALVALLLSFTINASEYCFNKNKPIHLIRYELKSFLVSGESVVIKSQRNCLKVNTRPERAVFISKVIHSTFSEVLLESSESQYTKNLCKLKLKEVTKLKEKSVEEVSDIITTEGNSFDIDLGDELVSLVCKKTGGTYTFDLGRKSQKKLTTLPLKVGKWFDLSAFTNLIGKQYSLMVVD